MLDWITRSGVAIKGGSREFPQKFTFLDILEKWRVVEVGGRDQVLRQLGLHHSLLDQFIEGMEVRRPPVLGVAFCSRGVNLKGDDLSLELLIEQLQFFLFAKDVVTIDVICARSRSHCSCSFICSFISRSI